MTAETRERPSLHWPAFIALVVAGLLLGGCDGPRTTPTGSPQHYDRLPERTGEQAAYELLDTLFSNPVTVDLPSGLTTLPPEESSVAFGLPNLQLPVPPTSGSRGAVAITFKPPNQGRILWFLVYDTAADAEAAFHATDAIRRPSDYDLFTPTAFDFPARCRSGPYPPNFPGSGNFTACLVVAGNLIVAGTASGGTSNCADDPRRCEDQPAIAMARAALAHLRQVQGTLARAAAAAAARPPVRVGILFESNWHGIARFGDFRRRLTALGWVRGHDLAIEYRFADARVERLPELAAELVRERVDVIVPLSLPAALAARDAAADTSIPVVFVLWDGSDPVAGGLVPSLARPEANMTGIAFPDTAGLAAKRLDLLAEALPSVRRVGVLIESTSVPLWRELEETARARGIELLPVGVSSPAEIPAAVVAAKEGGAEALLQADSTTNAYAAAPVLNQVAPLHGLPVVLSALNWVGLFAYEASRDAALARGAEYVDLVLRGTPPAQLPVELVRDYELLVNLNLAHRLGLEIAPSVLARANEVIDVGAVRTRRVR